eukprot:GHVO01033303.1.p1 GENE.GHVO01033303.1~~GHVO01033303.1.p1  ORF type:complete len:185 (-),score=24.76 GHVO01033303.1:83-637(-)
MIVATNSGAHDSATWGDEFHKFDEALPPATVMGNCGEQNYPDYDDVSKQLKLINARLIFLVPDALIEYWEEKSKLMTDNVAILSEASTVDSIVREIINCIPAIGIPPQPTIGIPPQPTIGIPPQPTIGIPPQPTIGIPPQPTIGIPPVSTSGQPSPVATQPRPLATIPIPGATNNPRALRGAQR